jgi:hypothetical protein
MQIKKIAVGLGSACLGLSGSTPKIKKEQIIAKYNIGRGLESLMTTESKRANIDNIRSLFFRSKSILLELRFHNIAIV